MAWDDTQTASDSISYTEWNAMVTFIKSGIATAGTAASGFILVAPVLGTPASGTLTNCTGLPISTGVSGLAAGVATFLGTPSSANLISAVTDETGTGALVFANTPTLVTPILGTPTSGTLTSCTGLPISTGVSGLGANVATFLATPSSANLISAVSDETGTGALVFANTPTLVTPILGTPTSGTLTNCTGLPAAGLVALTASRAVVSDASGFISAATTTSTQIGYLSAATGTTGTTSTNIVFSTSPTLVTPALGTPSSGTLTSCTGLPISTGVSGLAAGVATFLATPSSANLISAVTDETGTGALVFANTPTLVTPVIGVATATSVNKVAITAPATSATLTLIDGTTVTGPASTGTMMTLSNTETVTGVKTFGSAGAVGRLKIAGTTSGAVTLDAPATASTYTITLPAATDTLVGKATTDTFTNKTFDADGTGNSITNIENADIKAAAAIALNKLAATTASRALVSDGSGFVSAATTTSTQIGYLSAATGTTGTTSTNVVFSTSPTLVTPLLGTPTSGTLTNCTGLPAAGIVALTASRAVVSDGSGFISAATTTSTEIGYVNGVTSAIQTQFSNITTGVTNINLAASPASDHTGSGTTITGTAGEDLAIGDIVYGKLSTTYKWFKVDADAEASSKGALGVVTETITSGNTGKILLYGVFRDDTYAWTVGASLYLSTTPGALTETAPSGSADIVRIAAYALTADIILFQPEASYIELA